MQELQNWLEEQKSAYLYQTIVQYETDENKKHLFTKLAAAAYKQADIWRRALVAAGQPEPATYKPDLRTKIAAWLLRHFSVQQLRLVLAALKVRGLSIYDRAAVVGAAHELHADDNGAWGNLRATIFGVNDGLISNTCLLLGIAGAANNPRMTIISGVAGLLAGACSMAAGEYISMRSQQDFFNYQISLEQEELELYPEEEAAELALIYKARGMSEEHAQQVAHHIIQHPQHALNTLAREELGLDPNNLGSPLGAACSSFVAFTIGAAIPLLPFIFCASEAQAVQASIACTGASLFIIGSALSLFSNQNALRSGLRMLSLGALAGGFTYFIGILLNVVVH